MRARTAAWLLFPLLLVAAGALGLRYFAGHSDDPIPLAPPSPLAEPLPHDPASGLDPFAARVVPAEARCPVCGMYPARYPRWAAQLIFRDGAALFFDSPLELFRFLFDMGHYHSAHGPDEVARAYVTDAGDGQWIPAAEAYFVQGSGLSGPMRGPDLPAFANAEAAEAFVVEQGGSLIRLEQITRDLLQSPGESDRHHP